MRVVTVTLAHMPMIITARPKHCRCKENVIIIISIFNHYNSHMVQLVPNAIDHMIT